jgi:hypothetical protein
MQFIKRFGKQLGFVVLMSSSIFSVSLVSTRLLPIGSMPTESVIRESVPAPARRAMTWIINTAVYSNLYKSGNIYVQARYDAQTNVYSGDTSIDLALPLLCIYKSKELINNPIPTFTQSAPTPGGAEKNSWSGGKVFAIPNVVGRSLLSSTDADHKCNEAGKNRYGLSGSRMAEFHDGSAPNAGWGFWAESIDPNLLIPGNRYWVRINDQNANPW